MSGRTGVWLVGARGSVATSAVCGAAALQGGLVEPVGCVTERPEFAAAGLPACRELRRRGGHSRVLLCSVPDALPDRMPATAVKDLLLRLAEVEQAEALS